MAVRVPQALAPKSDADSTLAIDVDIMAEKATALGRAGEKVEKRLALLSEGADDGPERERLLKAAAEAVHAYFIQRELCGMRRHEAVIREYAIPRAVLVRLGAR